jgi:hypothetical protein
MRKRPGDEDGEPLPDGYPAPTAIALAHRTAQLESRLIVVARLKAIVAGLLTFESEGGPGPLTSGSANAETSRFDRDRPVFGPQSGMPGPKRPHRATASD